MPPSFVDADALTAALEAREVLALLDVRDAGEYETGHIPAATSLPRRDVEFRLLDLVPARDTTVVLYDDGEGRAELAAKTLGQLDYSAVRLLTGGIAAWRASGRRVVAGINVPSKVLAEELFVRNRIPEVRPEDLARGLGAQNAPLIIDVRSPEEYRRASIPGAVNVPSGDLPLLAGDLIDRHNGAVVVHCASRTRGLIGAQTLRELGVRDVYVLRNGTMGWQLAGLELENRPKRVAPTPSAESRTVAAALAEPAARTCGVRRVSADALMALRAASSSRPLYLFDVRSEVEYAEGHAPGAVSAPGDQLVLRADDFIAVPEATIVLVCDGGARAAVSAAWLRRMGFPDVATVDGGMSAWAGADLPLERGARARHVAGLADAMRAVPALSPDELAVQLGRNATLLLDVSTSLQHERQHVPGARWVSRGSLESAITRVAADRRQAIVVTCVTGEQSALAAWTVLEMGYTCVGVLAGGVRAWMKAGRPTATGLEAPLGATNDVALRKLASGDLEAMREYLAWGTGLALQKE